MSEKDNRGKMKSAYELALERLQDQGIEPPRREGLAPEVQDRIAQVRSKTAAKLAQLEILLRDRLRKLQDPAERAATQEEYRLERERLESKRDHEINTIRSGS